MDSTIQDIEIPNSFSPELRDLMVNILQREVNNRLGCRGRGADEVKEHPFFADIDWQLVYLQKYNPPLIPPRGEVNAADAFDIGSFDEEDTKGIKLTDADQELYREFPAVISERWQQEITETVFETINQETDKIEAKKKAKMRKLFEDEKDSDCILQGYMKKLGGPFAARWSTQYLKLYPNRIEVHNESGGKPDLIFMDQIEEVCRDFVSFKNEQCIVLKKKGDQEKDGRIILNSNDEIALKEWHLALTSTHRMSTELLSSMAKKATKIYGAAGDRSAPTAISGSGSSGGSQILPQFSISSSPLINLTRGNN